MAFLNKMVTDSVIKLIYFYSFILKSVTQLNYDYEEPFIG